MANLGFVKMTFSREQLEAAAAVIMRVPGLFIIDYWWQHDLAQAFPGAADMMEILNAVITNLVLVIGFLLLLLPLSHVKVLYTHFACGVLIVCSHLVSKFYISTEVEDSAASQTSLMGENFYKKQLAMLTFHGFSTSAISYLINGPWKPYPPLLGCYVLPVLARLADLPLVCLEVLHNFSSAIMAFNIFLYITHQVPSILDFVKTAYGDILITADVHGFIALLTRLWNKLFVPNHFVVFWLVEFFAKIFKVIYQNPEMISTWGDEWYIIILVTISSICASPVTIIATSVTVSYLSFFVLSGTQAYLQGRLAFHQENPLHSGYTEGLTLVLLALQTGIAEMKMPTRVGAMTIILFIVLSCLLQSMLEIAEPIVLSLSASRNHSIGRHFRAISLCIALLTLPLYLSRVLSQVFPIDFWMMVLLSGCLLTSVHVIDLLIVHCLFLHDSVISDTWENLDDIVYYVRAITKILEFFVAVVVVGMAVLESTTVRLNWINGSVLIVHCYINVWQRLRNGWQSFLLRREAVKKSATLPSASELQLRDLDDVCSICYAEMKAACITPCQHYFHRTCLRKWLYAQDKCPLCHSVITMPTVAET